jgi:hypothetical protein
MQINAVGSTACSNFHVSGPRELPMYPETHMTRQHRHNAAPPAQMRGLIFSGLFMALLNFKWVAVHEG